MILTAEINKYFFKYMNILMAEIYRVNYECQHFGVISREQEFKFSLGIMIVFFKKKISVEKQEFLHLKLVVFFPLETSHYFSKKCFKSDIVDFTRAHTIGNPNSEPLYSVEDPKSLIRKIRGKEQEGVKS